MTFLHSVDEAAPQPLAAAGFFQARRVETPIGQAPARGAWADRRLSELTDHIVEAFHQPLLKELPRLRALTGRLQDHTDQHCRTVTIVEEELRQFEATLVKRVTADEDELFPLIHRIEADRACDEESRRLVALRSDAEMFHEDAARTIWLLRTITDGYGLPSDACAALRALYRGLSEFEQLMRLYAHLEIKVLFRGPQH